MTVILANPRGFCAGVDRAIDIVDRALDLYGAPIYVRHEVVHNKYVVDTLRARGAVFVEELDEIPDDATVIFSAHGVSRVVQQGAEQRALRVFDATCPLVTKVHVEVARFGREGRDCILVGHRGHPEVEGTMGQYDTSGGGTIYLVEDEAEATTISVQQSEYLAYVTQTTLSVDDTQRIVAVLRERFPTIVGPRKDDICYATQNRQDAVKQLALECDVVLVVGSPNSSNSNRLRELAERCGACAYLIDQADEIQRDWLLAPEAPGNELARTELTQTESPHLLTIGVTAGASAPEKLVQDVLARLAEFGVNKVVDQHGKIEKTSFSMPVGLR
ncbi:MAG: 4-hydroxy-3-methylbut-2-enyl diphosphate reductase [Porticoccaceae bacterium]